MRIERWLVAAGLALFLISLALPALVSESFPAQSGLDLLRQRAEFARNDIYAWYANPVLSLALILAWLRYYRSGLVAAALGMLLALSIFTAPAALAEAGRSLPEFRYGTGFYVWLGAFVCALAAGISGLLQKNVRGSD